MESFLIFGSGLVLGLSMILPIGPQNVFVLTQGIMGGWRRGLVAAAVAGICDTTLITVGGAGIASVLGSHPTLQIILLWLGVVFLAFLGFQSLRQQENDKNMATGSSDSSSTTGIDLVSMANPNSCTASGSDSSSTSTSIGRLVVTGVAVSWGNPHAILDTVVILGSAIAAQTNEHKLAFAVGAICASWLFFSF